MAQKWLLHLYLKNGKTELYVNINRVEESNNLIGPLFIRITACKMQVYLNWHFVNFLVKATVPHPTAVIALFLGLLSAVLYMEDVDVDLDQDTRKPSPLLLARRYEITALVTSSGAINVFITRNTYLGSIATTQDSRVTNQYVGRAVAFWIIQ
jgi:hypothetical protein